MKRSPGAARVTVKRGVSICGKQVGGAIPTSSQPTALDVKLKLLTSTCDLRKGDRHHLALIK
jgi:hypothetical protein